MGALLCATAAGRVANGPAHGITRGNRRDRLARLQSNVGDALGGGIEPIERPVAIGIDLPRADESGVRRLAQRGLRSEERRVGKECVSTCRSRWPPEN